MRITFDPVAADDLAQQLDYLIATNSVLAASRLATRLSAFLENFLATHPRTGKFIPEPGIWETWIPGTKLIIWYRFSDDQLDVIRIWHTARNR